MEQEPEHSSYKETDPRTILDKPQTHSRAITRNGLTYKQDRFAKLIAEGHKIEDCFRMAYPTSRDRPRAQVLADASKVKSNPKVQERIQEYISKAERYASYNPAKLRMIAIETIMSIAQNEKSRDGDRLKAAELLGKMSQVNLFTEGSNTDSIQKLSSAIDLEAKLRALAALSNKGSSAEVIDITPQSTEP